MTDLILRIKAAKEPLLLERRKALEELMNWWVREWFKAARRTSQPKPLSATVCAERKDDAG